MIRLRSLSKIYASPAGPFHALREVDLDVARGEMLSVVGRSGSGKSTLLNLIAGLDRPTSGTVHVRDRAVHDLAERELAAWRGANVGVVFQFFQLLPTLTVVENVMLPMDFLGLRPRRERRSQALSLLASVDIAEQADKLPLELSGGQQQRAAIARALANDPSVLVADEPTGNLDATTSASVFALLRRLADRGTTVILATHERDVPGLDRSVELRDGALVPTAMVSSATSGSAIAVATS